MHGLKRKFATVVAALTLAGTGSMMVQSPVLAKTTVTFWCQFGDIYREGVMKVADAFNKSQSRINVKVVTVGEGSISQEKLMSAMAAGAPPDISTLADLLVAEYAQKKLLLALDPYMKAAGYSSKNFWKAAWNVTFYNDKQWALPFTEDCRAMYYNKQVFREAGFDPERPPKTLEDLESMASKLFKGDGQKYTRLGYVPWGGNWWFYGWGWLFGGDFWNPKQKTVSCNDPKNMEALEWLVKFAQRYDIKRMSRAPQDFFKGSLVMYNDGNWNVGNIRKSAPKGFEYGVAPVPPPQGRGLSTWSGVWTLVIPRGAKHAKEAWEFLEYAGGPTGQLIFAKHTSQTPANMDATKAGLDDLVKVFGPQVTPFIDLMEYSHHRPTIPVGSYLWDTLDAAQWSALNGRKGPAQALEDANRLVQKELEKVLIRTKDRK